MAKADTQIRVSLIDGVTRSLTEIQRGVTGLGASIAKVNQAAELTGRAFGVLGSALGGIADAASAVGGVEDALTRVATVTRATTAEQVQLRAAIDDALTNTRFGADEASAALLSLAKDGLTATESAQNLGNVLAYAQSSAQGAAQAAQGLGAVLDSFGAPAAEIGALADALTATAQAAGTSTETLQQGLAGVGLEAQNAGLSLNQTLAILGQLAQRGLEGGAAAAALNKALTSLQNPSAALSGVFDDLNLTGKSVSEILTTLQGNSAAAEKVLSELGDRPRRALRLLVQEGGGDLKKFAEAIDSSAGASQKAAEALNNTFLGSLQRIQNQLTLLKNDVLAPILKPLADEFDSFAKQLREFSKSEEFAKLVEDIRKFASEGIKAVGDFVRDFDFAKALRNAQAFASDVKVVFEGLASAIGVAASAIDAVKTRLASRDLSFSSLALSLNELSRGANASELGLRTLQGTLGLTDEQTAQLANTMRQAGIEIPKVGNAAASSAAKLVGFAAGAQSIAEKLARLAAGDSGFNAAASAAEAFRKALSDATQETDTSKGKVSESADAFVRLAGGADQAALGLERLRLAQITQKLTELALAGQQGTAAFSELLKQSGQTEENIKRLADKLAGASDETDRLGSSAERAGSDLRDLKGSVDDVADSAENLSNKNSQVRDSFGNIGAAASSTAISLGNLSEEYVRQALAAAGATKSAKEYANTLNRAFAAGQEQQKQLSERLAERQKLILSLDEEAQALERLRQQYPAIAENELRKLYDAEKRITELRERKNKATREGIDLEQQAATAAGGTAGGLNTGTQRPANTAPATPAPTATQPTGGAGSITINVSGFVTQDALDQVVNRIQRAGLLAR